MMHSKTDSQDPKLKIEHKWARHWNYYTVAIYYKSLSMSCRWSVILWLNRSFINTSVSGSKWRISSGVSSAIRLLFLVLSCFIVENVLLHTYVFQNIECNFSAKYFRMRNLSCWLISGWSLQSSLTLLKLYVLIKRCYACSN